MKNLKMVMLPTKQTSDVSIITNNVLSSCLKYKHKNHTQRNEFTDFQHLYVINTKEPIGQVGCVYSEKLNRIYSKTEDFNVEGRFYKVIASTDESLGLKEIPTELVSLFIEKHNKGMELSARNWSKYFWNPTHCREAMSWWNKLTDNEKLSQIFDVYPERSEIIEAYENRPQVNFNDLKHLTEFLRSNPEYLMAWEGGIENLVLFMDMIGKSSSFAHKAHVLLRK